MVKGRVLLGMGDLPPFNRNPYNGYINPYYWVDDHPLLYGNNGSLDPGTYVCCTWKFKVNTTYAIICIVYHATLHGRNVKYFMAFSDRASLVKMGFGIIKFFQTKNLHLLDNWWFQKWTLKWSKLKHDTCLLLSTHWLQINGSAKINPLWTCEISRGMTPTVGLNWAKKQKRYLSIILVV